ncbi:methyltransferase family protein [Streptohalobacillus salinus]|uniref:Methyltransferase family protein n=2 Tax=Streptohalobacillus salinus TaxID=621096 RepID=A0A2V3WGB3_9BACI|nr:methyltransferase family protein [Streptohalobacillus salinus]
MGKIMSFVYDTAMAPLERMLFHRLRKQHLTQLSGTVLEIGAGTGVNFKYYPDTVDFVLAIEPESSMIQRAKKKVHALPISIKQQSAEDIDAPDNTFDVVIATLVFCSIDQPDKALEEIKRVLKPNGTILFIEHVRSEEPALAWLQDKLTPAWRHVADNCHLNRDTGRLIATTFTITYQAHYARKIVRVFKAKQTDH